MMKAFLLKGLRLALMASAVGLLCASPSSAQTTKAWTRGGGNNLWSTSANWSPGGAPSVIGTQTTFSATSPRPGTVSVATDTVRLGNMTITGGNYTFSGAGKVWFAGAADLTNNSAGTVSFANIAANASQSVNIKGTGTTTIAGFSTLGGSLAGSLNIQSKVIMQASGPDVTNPAGLQVSAGGDLTLGTYTSPVTGLSNNGGIIRGAANGSQYMNATVNGLDLLGGTASMAIGGDLSYDQIISADAVGAPDTMTFGGNLDLNLGPLGSGTLTNNTVLQLFSFDPTRVGGTFNNVAFTNSAASPYNGLTFTNNGSGEWTTPMASNGQYFVFYESSGALVVVPEPSTIVFAGIGVGMAGWTTWKKRRLARVLAKK